MRSRYRTQQNKNRLELDKRLATQTFAHPKGLRVDLRRTRLQIGLRIFVVVPFGIQGLRRLGGLTNSYVFMNPKRFVPEQVWMMDNL